MVLLGHIFFDEINQLLPVPHIWARSLELHPGCLVIVAVWHSMNHNHESCTWQLWEVNSRFLPARSPKSITSRLLPCLPFFFTVHTSLAHLFKDISTHCGQIHSPLSKISRGRHVSKVSKKCVTAILQCRGPSPGCFKQFCPRIMDRCFLCRNPATHTFFNLLKTLKLGYPIQFANCFKENPVFFKLIGVLPMAPPKPDKSSLS